MKAHLTGACKQEPRPCSLCKAKHIHCAKEAGLQGLDRIVSASIISAFLSLLTSSEEEYFHVHFQKQNLMKQKPKLITIVIKQYTCFTSGA